MWANMAGFSSATLYLKGVRQSVALVLPTQQLTTRI